MNSIQRSVAASAIVAAFGFLSSNVAHAALSQYSITSTVGQTGAAMAGYTPQVGDVLQGTFSYLSSDTVLGAATLVRTNRYSTLYAYEMPAEARIDFTLGGHSFSSSKVSLVVSKSDWVEAGPDTVGVIGQNLTMDGVAVSAGLVGFEFVYPLGSIIQGQPPQTLQLNAPIPKGSAFTWKSTGYIAQNGGVGLSALLAGGGGSANATFSPQALAVATVPEPGTWALMLLGLGSVAWLSARQPAKRGA